MQGMTLATITATEKPTLNVESIQTDGNLNSYISHPATSMCDNS